MEETTTEAVVDTGADTAQPVESEKPAEAVDTATETSTQDTTNEPSSEDDNSKWLASKGIDPTDPEAINKLTKSAREAERMATQRAQRANELERSMTQMSDDSAEEVAYSTGQDAEVLKRLQRFEVKNAVRDFLDAHPDAKQFELQMVEEMNNSGLFGTPEAMLQAAYYAVLGKDQSGLKSQARIETLENLAQKQQASVPRGNATTASITTQQKITPSNVDQLVANNDLNWFKKHYDEINRALAGQ